MSTVAVAATAAPTVLPLRRATTFFLNLAFLAWPFWGFSLVNVGHTGITYTTVFGFIAILLRIAQLCTGGEARMHRAWRWAILIGCSTLFSATSIVSDGAPELEATIRTTTHLFFLVALALAWGAEERSAVQVLRLFRGWLWFSVPICLFGIYQIFARVFGLPMAWLTMTNSSLIFTDEVLELQQLSLRFGNFYRATSVFSEPSTLGLYVLHCLVMFGVAIAGRRSEIYFRRRWMRIAVVMIYLTTLFLTYSLGAFFTGIVLLIVMMITLSGVRRGILLRNLALGTAVFLTVDLAVLNPVFHVGIAQLTAQRVRGIIAASRQEDSRELVTGDSYPKRLREIRNGLRIWSEYPLRGAGLGRYAELSGAEKYGAAFYVRILAELGIVGFAVFTLFGFLLARRLLLLRLRFPPGSPEWTAAVTGGFLMLLMMLHGMFSEFLHSEVYWMEAGIAFVIAKTLQPERVDRLRIWG
jgi:hypothetical protein